MNYEIILFILGWVIKLEGFFLLLPSLVGLIYQERAGYSFLIIACFCMLLGHFITRNKPKNSVYFVREGFIIVSLSWIVMSIFGALPFVFNGDIPHFVDALFETVSGFTTTGASILKEVEVLNKSSIFWRSFTHWIGGMGVFVFLLAILPMAGGYNMHLMRAESPGPAVGKLVPRLRDTAKILYIIYFAMTVIQIILLIMVKMPIFDAVTTALGTAGTGGFGIKNDSMASYSIPIQAIITIFMILFGVNFNFYYYMIRKRLGEAFAIEEVRYYILIILVSSIVIALNTLSFFDNFLLSFHHAAFQVGSIITTTGFVTVDFNAWPALSRTILVLLMFIGACAGSTGGGIKVSRILILFRSVKQEISSFIHPRIVKNTRFEGRALDKEVVKSVGIFMITYIFLYALSVLLISIDEFDLVTNFTAVAATINNIGPGLEMVGPTGNFHAFSPFSKLVLVFDMLAGRLELYPMLLLCIPSMWNRRR